MSAPRASYSEVGRAVRLAVARAVASGDGLSTKDYHVLLAALSLTATYSRLADTVTVGQVAATANCSTRTASRSLRRLNDLGVLRWSPKRGLGVSVLSLPSETDTLAVSFEADTLSVSNADSKTDTLPVRSNRTTPAAAFREGFREDSNSTDAELSSQLEAVGWSRDQIRAGLADPERAQAWLVSAQSPNIANAGGFAWSSFTRGGWPHESSTTGYRRVRGTHGESYVPDPEGKDSPPPWFEGTAPAATTARFAKVEAFVRTTGWQYEPDDLAAELDGKEGLDEHERIALLAIAHEIREARR